MNRRQVATYIAAIIILAFLVSVMVQGEVTDSTFVYLVGIAVSVLFTHAIKDRV